MTHVALIVALSLVIQTRDGGASPPDVYCGSYCLFAALKAQGLSPSSYEELEKQLGPPTPQGYTIRQLEQVAQARGGKTIAVETTVENILARPESFACITLMGKGHYILLYDADDREVHIIDPPRKYVLPLDTFRANWTRKALLVGRDGFAPEESIDPGRQRRLLSIAVGSVAIGLFVAGSVWSFLRRRSGGLVARAFAFLAVVTAPILGAACAPRDHSRVDTAKLAAADLVGKLIADPQRHDLGNVWLDRPDRKIRAVTKLTNIGPGDLKIESISKGCDCTTVTIDRRTLHPGEKAMLDVRIRPGNIPGGRTSLVQIQSTDTLEPVLELTFAWIVKNPLHAAAADLKWLGLRPGKGVANRVPIFLENLPLCPRCRFHVTPNSPQVTCTFRRGGGTASSHDAQPTLTAEQVGELGIAIPAPDDTEYHRDVISLALLCDGETRATLSLPISWRMSPVLELSPERLSLGASGPGERFTRKIMVRSSSGQPFRLLRVSCSDFNALVSSRFVDGAEPVHFLELDLAAPDASGPWRTEIALTTDHPDAGRVTLPLSALLTRGVITETKQPTPVSVPE